MSKLTNPIAVFDAGIGSYDIVRQIRARYPRQDLVYFADREAFPYGSKSPEELRSVVGSAIRYLSEDQNAKEIIIASNVPTITIFDQIKDDFPALKIHGVRPPVKKAFDLSISNNTGFGVLGVKAMVESPLLRDFTYGQIPAGAKAVFVNASPLIDGFVENGKFASDAKGTQESVSNFMAEIEKEHPNVKVWTLSSTHLPWLRTFFETACPNMLFVDPTDDILKNIPFPNNGTGDILAITTENAKEGLTATQINETFSLIQEPITITPVGFRM